MGANNSDPKYKSDDNPFEVLKDSLEKEKLKAFSEETSKIIVMGTTEEEASWLQSTDKRNFKSRIDVDTGYAIIYDQSGSKIITKAILRNVSPGGVGLEVLTIDVAKGATVMIEFGGKGLKMGAVKCTLQWMSAIKGHSKGHKLVGFQFVNPTPQTKKTLQSYLESIKKNAGRDD